MLVMFCDFYTQGKILVIFSLQGHHCNFTAFANATAQELILLNIMAQYCAQSCGYCMCANNDTSALAQFNATCSALAQVSTLLFDSTMRRERALYAIRTTIPSCLIISLGLFLVVSHPNIRIRREQKYIVKIFVIAT